MHCTKLTTYAKISDTYMYIIILFTNYPGLIKANKGHILDTTLLANIAMKQLETIRFYGTFQHKRMRVRYFLVTYNITSKVSFTIEHIAKVLHFENPRCTCQCMTTTYTCACTFTCMYMYMYMYIKAKSVG